MRTPWARNAFSWPLKAVKPALRATGAVGVETSITLIEPSGSIE